MYKRVLLKLSGESLGGPEGKGLSPESLNAFASEIVAAVRGGAQVAIVNGGGKIFRGLQGNALKVLEDGGVALIAGGTGNPFFTTDSGAALRALELGADALLKGTRVDGVYTADPEKDPTAVRYEELTFSKALADHLKVMDQTAYSLCEQGPVPIVVFDVTKSGNLARLLGGEPIGTIVHA